VVISDVELDRVRKLHQLRSYRIGSMLRIGVVGPMPVATLIGTARAEWAPQFVLIGVYATAALLALELAFSPFHRPSAALGRLEPCLFDVSSRRAAVVLACTVVGFALALFDDPEFVAKLGWAASTYVSVLYGFLCCAALVVVRSVERHTRSIASLSALREELLARTMTASEVLQRRIRNQSTMAPFRTCWLCARNSSSWTPHSPAMSG
jgi:two-component system, NarL family, sensor kinase